MVAVALGLLRGRVVEQDGARRRGHEAVRPAQDLHQVLGEAQLERERGVRPPPFEEAFQAQRVEAVELGRQGALSRPSTEARRGATAQLRRREQAPPSWTRFGKAWWPCFAHRSPAFNTIAELRLLVLWLAPLECYTISSQLLRGPPP